MRSDVEVEVRLVHAVDRQQQHVLGRGLVTGRRRAHRAERDGREGQSACDADDTTIRNGHVFSPVLSGADAPTVRCAPVSNVASAPVLRMWTSGEKSGQAQRKNSLTMQSSAPVSGYSALVVRLSASVPSP